MAEKFQKGGQDGWFHDRGHWGGFFHTYDALQVGSGEMSPRQVHIFLPRDYEVSGESYPVIYMNDGDTAFFPGGAYHKTWNMAGILTRLYLRDRLRRVIVVAVCTHNRDYEYTHAPVFGCEWGGLGDYSAYLAHNLKGFVDTHYRTLTHPDNTLVLGSSHGGLAAFYTAVRYPHAFGCVAALSPSFWVGLDSNLDPSLFALLGSPLASLETSALWFTASGTLQDPSKRLKIYLDWGLVREGGFHNAFIEERATVRGREMRDLLVRDCGYWEGENLFVVEDEIGQHREESWAGRMESALELFFGV